jgi:hypothetical protein
MTTRKIEKSYWNEKIEALYLWSIRRQDSISLSVRTHMWSAVFAILLMSYLIPIKLEIALQIIFFGGLTTCAVLWVFIERRKNWLLNIQDPVLRDTAHQAMIAYLKNKIDTNHHCGQESDEDRTCRTC